MWSTSEKLPILAADAAKHIFHIYRTPARIAADKPIMPGTHWLGLAETNKPLQHLARRLLAGFEGCSSHPPGNPPDVSLTAADVLCNLRRQRVGQHPATLSKRTGPFWDGDSSVQQGRCLDRRTLRIAGSGRNERRKLAVHIKSVRERKLRICDVYDVLQKFRNIGRQAVGQRREFDFQPPTPGHVVARAWMLGAPLRIALANVLQVA